MLIFIDGPDESGKDTVAKAVSWLTGIPVLDTISGDILFKELTPPLRKYHVIHEYNILKAIDWRKVDLIKVRNTAISHEVYHPEDKIDFTPIKESMVFILDDGSDDVHKYVDVARKQGWDIQVLVYKKRGLDELFDVAEKIANVINLVREMR